MVHSRRKGQYDMQCPSSGPQKGRKRRGKQRQEMGTWPCASFECEVKDLEAELERVSRENKELRVMLHTMRNNYDTLQAHAEKLKREMQAGTECCSSQHFTNRRETEPLRPKTSRVFVRTEANDTSLVVKDGYQWRKYGQKVTKDNPSPRAYFRCARAPECPVKKKVQRCADEHLVLMATYEGEHNHEAPRGPDSSNPLNGTLTCSATKIPAPVSSVIPSQPTVTVDLTLAGAIPHRKRPQPSVPKETGDKKKTCRSNSSGGSGEEDGSRRTTKWNSDNVAFHGNNKSLEEYMTSLMQDPSFRTALAGAVASSILRTARSSSG